MSEIEDFDIKKTSHVTIRDVLDEKKIIAEGDVIAFKEIAGTNRTRIILDPPLWIEATEVE